MPTAPLEAIIPWSRLLRDIHNHQVLPIIGPGLVTHPDARGEETPYVTSLSLRLARKLGVDSSDATDLNRVACAHLMAKGKRNDIYEELREMVEADASLPIPRGIADLAAIRDFDLFVTSTFDPFLARSLRQTRPGYRPEAGGLSAFHPNNPIDLPVTPPPAFVYHVLGAWDTYPDFAVWEEDFLEFLCGLLEQKDSLKNLFDQLGHRSLLLIGSPFDDWIVRFFLRVAKRKRLSTTECNDYLAENPCLLGEPMVFYFDKITGSPRILPLAPAEFVAELRKRWEEKYATLTTQELLDSIPDDMERSSVFISYSRDDLETALTLAGGLRAAGIPVWLDKKRLNPGGDWETALMRAVKSRSSLFISLISCATEADGRRYVHTERKWAAEMHVPGEVFYIPVIIDNTRTPSMEPEVFSRIHRHHLPDGEVDEKFALLISRYLKQYREHGEVRDV